MSRNMSIACCCTRNTFIYHSSRRSNLETWRNIIVLQQHENISRNYQAHRKNVIRSVGSSGSSTPPTPSSDTKKVPENKINEAPLSKSTQLTEKANQISEQTYKILEIIKATSKVLTERATLFYTDKRNYLTNAKIINPEGEEEHWYSARVNFLMKRYENFVGLTDVKNAQARVQKTEKLFITSQDDRRETQRLLNEVQGKIKSLHTELERTHRGEEKYLELVTLEHQILREERNMTEQLTSLEKDEREVFSRLSRAVRNSHESERAQAEKTKYWAVIGSIIGTTLGVMGTTINNRLRMRELRQIVRDATAAHGQAEIGAAALTIAASKETLVMDQINEQPISIETEVVTELQNKMEKFVKQVESFENLTSEKITEVSNSISKLSENLSEQQNKSTEVLSLLERRPVTIPKGEILPDTINKKDIIILQKSLETQIMLWEEKVDDIMKAHLEKSDSSKSLNALERKVTQVLAFEKEMIENTARMYHDHNRSIKIAFDGFHKRVSDLEDKLKDIRSMLLTQSSMTELQTKVMINSAASTAAAKTASSSSLDQNIKSKEASKLQKERTKEALDALEKSEMVIVNSVEMSLKQHEERLNNAMLINSAVVAICTPLLVYAINKML